MMPIPSSSAASRVRPMMRPAIGRLRLSSTCAGWLAFGCERRRGRGLILERVFDRGFKLAPGQRLRLALRPVRGRQCGLGTGLALRPMHRTRRRLVRRRTWRPQRLARGGLRRPGDGLGRPVTVAATHAHGWKRSGAGRDRRCDRRLFLGAAALRNKGDVLVILIAELDAPHGGAKRLLLALDVLVGVRRIGGEQAPQQGLVLAIVDCSARAIGIPIKGSHGTRKRSVVVDLYDHSTIIPTGRNPAVRPHEFPRSVIISISAIRAQARLSSSGIPIMHRSRDKSSHGRDRNALI